MENLNLEVVLRVLNCFSESGISTISYKILSQYGFKQTYLKKALDNLLELGKIEKINKNGFYPMYKLNETLDCYEFILDDKLTYQMKEILCRLIKILPSFEKIPPRKIVEIDPSLDINVIYRINNKIKDFGEGDVFEILKNKSSVVRRNLKDNNFGMVINHEGQIQIDNTLNSGDVNIKTSEFQCKICGETDPNKFGNCKSKSICTSCINKRSKLNIIKNLLTNCKKSLRTRRKREGILKSKLEFNLDEEYLLDLLNKQEGRCYYSGIKLDSESLHSNPSLDRIDSNKGYIKGNVCICSSVVNKAKSDLTIDQFKEMITNLYNNINNF